MVSNSENDNKKVIVEQDIPETITIPGPAIEIDMSRVRGDWESRIRFEINVEETQNAIDKYKDEEKHPGYVDVKKEFLEFMQAGGRIFITESDNEMFVAPEGKDVPFPLDHK